MGGWIGGQAEYVMVPYADFNLLKFPNKDQAMEKIKDLTLLSDIFPTGYHGAVSAGVGPGKTVYVAGAGPVGLACAASAHLLGAACVIVGDMIPERLEQARSFGCETIDLRQDASLQDQVAAILGMHCHIILSPLSELRPAGTAGTLTYATMACCEPRQEFLRSTQPWIASASRPVVAVTIMCMKSLHRYMQLIGNDLPLSHAAAV
eukprot:scaffold1293_cov375-Prasinococcus_capsulatus_cf.AAC.7